MAFNRPCEPESELGVLCRFKTVVTADAERAIARSPAAHHGCGAVAEDCGSPLGQFLGGRSGQLLVQAVQAIQRCQSLYVGGGIATRKWLRRRTAPVGDPPRLAPWADQSRQLGALVTDDLAQVGLQPPLVGTLEDLVAGLAQGGLQPAIALLGHRCRVTVAVPSRKARTSSSEARSGYAGSRSSSKGDLTPCRSGSCVVGITTSPPGSYVIGRGSSWQRVGAYANLTPCRRFVSRIVIVLQYHFTEAKRWPLFTRLTVVYGIDPHLDGNLR